MNRLVATALALLSTAAFGAGVRLTGVPSETLEAFGQFTVSVEAQVDSGSLTGVYVVMKAAPAGAVRIVNITAGSATADSFVSSTGTYRILWADLGGFPAGSYHEIARVTYEVLSPPTSATADLFPNILELRGTGFAEISGAVAETSTIEILVPDPTPAPTVTVPSYDTDNPSGDGIGADVPTAVSSGGCAASADSPKTWIAILALALLGILTFRTKGFWAVLLVALAGTAEAKTVTIATADDLANLCQNRFSAGDVIVVGAGTFTLPSTVAITPTTCGNGEAGIPIILRGSGTLGTVLNGGGKAILGLGEGLNYWVIENLHFQNGGPWDRPEPYPDTGPQMIAGEGVNYGIVIRNNRFTGSISGSSGTGWPINKSVIYLYGHATIPGFNDGFVIEGNEFTNVDFSSGAAGYAYINVKGAAYSVIRKNTIRHTTESTAPYHLIEVDNAGGSIVERNFLYAALKGNSESSAVVVRRSNPAAVVRNNILYATVGEVSGSPTDWVPVSAFFIGEGSSGTKNLIHSNSVKLVKNGVNARLLVAHVYSYTWGDGAHVTNNVFEGGDYGVSSAWSSSSCTPGTRIDLDYNFTFGNTPYDNRQGSPEYRCSYSWENGVTDIATSFVAGSNWDQSSQYVLHTAPNPALTGGATALARCSTLKPGTSVNCTAQIGAYGGADPYDSTSMFSFCGVLAQSSRPDYDADRRLELEDVLRLQNAGNSSLANQLAGYLTTFDRTSLPCLNQSP